MLLLHLRLGTRRRPRVLLPSRALMIGHPWRKGGTSPGPVLALVLALPVRASASSNFALLLAFALSLGLPRALLTVAFDSTAILGLALQLG